jgi:hypothetical protein
MATSPSQIIPETQQLVHFNMLGAHLFNMLSSSQAMLLYAINPLKLLTINVLLEGSFLAIKATDNLPTPFVSARAVA